MRTSRGWQGQWGKGAAAFLLLIAAGLGIAPGGVAGQIDLLSASRSIPYALCNSNSSLSFPLINGTRWTASPPGVGWNWDDRAKRFYKIVPVQGNVSMTDYWYTKTEGGITTCDPSRRYRSLVTTGSTIIIWSWYNQNTATYERIPAIPVGWNQTDPTTFNRSAQRFERVTTDSSGNKWTDIIFLTQDRNAPHYGKTFRWYNQAECPVDRIKNHWYWFSGNTWVDYEQPPSTAPLTWNGLKSGSWNFWAKRFEMLREEKVGGVLASYIDVWFPKDGSHDPNQHWRWYQATNQWTWYNPVSNKWEPGRSQTVKITNTRNIATLVSIIFGGGTDAHKWTEFDWSVQGLNIQYVVKDYKDPTKKILVDPNGKWTLYVNNAQMVCELAAGASTTITYKYNHPTTGGDAMLFMSKETDPSKPLYDGYDKYNPKDPLAVWGNLQLLSMQTRFEWNFYRWLGGTTKKYGDGAFNLSMVNGYSGGLLVNSLDYKGVFKTLWNAQHMFQNWSNPTDRTYGLGSDWATWPFKPPYEYIFTNPTNRKFCNASGQPYEFRVADPYAPNAKNIGVKWDSVNKHWTGLDAPDVEKYCDTGVRTLSVSIGNKSLITGFIQRAGLPPIVKLAGGWLMEPRALNIKPDGFPPPPDNPVGWIDPNLGWLGHPKYRDFSKPYDPITNRYIPYLNNGGHLFWTPSQLGLLALLPK